MKKGNLSILIFFLLLGGLPLSICAADDSPQDKTTLAFNNADIRDVLNIIADEYGLNLVMSDEVSGNITLSLKDMSPHSALDAILLSRGFDYEIHDNMIRVASPPVLEGERKQRQAKMDLEPLVSEIVVLHYLDANEVKDMIKSMLTPRGSVTVLERRPFLGFQFGAGGPSGSSSSGGSSAPGDASSLIRSRATGAPQESRSNTLMVVDVERQVEKVKSVIKQVDIPPRQVMIDAKILEVDMDSLEDLGIDFNAEPSFRVGDKKVNVVPVDINTGESNGDINDGIFSNTFPSSTDAGIHAVFRKLNGEDFTTILHALLQNEKTKTLSAPQILTIENQEAAILVGEQFPIFETNVSDQGTATESLSFFQPVGIILQVIVQVTPNNDISMIIHPTVSSIGNLVTGTTGLTQPRINIREADTRVLMKNAQTLVIGGLLEDVVDEKYFRVPVLDSIPWVGKLFSRKQIDINQRNLLIFITPKIVDRGMAMLNSQQRNTFEGISDSDAYGFLQDRRKQQKDSFELAKRSFESKNYSIARILFQKVLRLDPTHEGAKEYLKKIEKVSPRLY